MATRRSAEPDASVVDASTALGNLTALWLDDSAKILRRAFHSDERLAADAEAEVTAKKAMRVLRTTGDGELRGLGQVFRALAVTPLNADDLAAVEALAARRRSIRDSLAVRLGRKDDEHWDALWNRITRSQKLLTFAGRLLHEIGATPIPPPSERSRPRPMALAAP